MRTMRNLRRPLIALISTLSLAISILIPTSSAAIAFKSAPVRYPGYIYAGEGAADLTVSPRTIDVVGEQKSEWNVTFVGFPEDAKGAVQFAIDIWARNFTSRVPINVEAVWGANANDQVLGTARPGFFFNSFPGAPDESLWYPSALANALAGKDLNPSQAEIFLQVNSTQLWYKEIDGKPDADSYDLVSVILHEIAHGLGFISNAEYDRFFGTGYMFQPTPFDAYVQLPDGRTFTDFCSRSVDLGKAMTAPLYWSGESGVAANNGVKPKLYAPATYEDGSSITHLDEATFRDSGTNSVMTPELNPGEVFAGPGAIAIAMIEDMLRKPPAGLASGLPAKPLNAQALVGDGYAMLTFETTNCTRIEKVTSYRVTIMPGNEVRRYESGPIRVTGLKNGKTYSFSIAAENIKGSSEEVQTNSVKLETTSTPKTIDLYSKVSHLTATSYKGKKVIFYGDLNTQSLKSATLTGGKWKIATVRKGVNVGQLSACRTGSGTKEVLNLFYAESESKDLIYSKLKNGKWTHQVVDGNGENVQDYREMDRRRTSSDVSTSNTCVATSKGLQVFYRDETQGILLGAVQSGNSWVYEIVDGDRKDDGRTTGDVAFNLAATNVGDMVYLVYDSVLSLNSSRVVTEGELRLAQRNSIYSEDWEYRTIDGPDFGSAVAGYATAIYRDKSKVLATWLTARGDSLPYPDQVAYAEITGSGFGNSITPTDYGRPSKPIAIDGAGLIVGCQNRVCKANLTNERVSLADGSNQISQGAQLVKIGAKRYLVFAENQKLSLLRI